MKTLDHYIEAFTERKKHNAAVETFERNARIKRVESALEDCRYVGQHGNRSAFIHKTLRPEVVVLVSVTGHYNQCEVSLIPASASYEKEGHCLVNVDLTADDGIDFMLRAIAERVVADVEDTHVHPAMQ